MLPLKHLFLAVIFSLVLYLIFPIIPLKYIGIIILSAVLIDIDHYLYYVFKKRDFSLSSFKNAYRWFRETERKTLLLPRKEREKVYGGFCFLHGVETLGVLLILGLTIAKTFFFIFIGFAFHLLTDIVHGTVYRDRIDRVSAVYDFFKFKNLRLINE